MRARRARQHERHRCWRMVFFAAWRLAAALRKTVTSLISKLPLQIGAARQSNVALRSAPPPRRRNGCLTAEPDALGVAAARGDGASVCCEC
jgi:hypothetical protein